MQLGFFRWSGVLACLAGAMFFAATARAADATQPSSGFDQYGGCLAIQGQKTGFFHLEKLGHRWMWITPQGHGFVALGVSQTWMQPAAWNGSDRTGAGYRDYCLKKYGSQEAWAQACAKRFRDWGFNFTGFYSSNGGLSSQGIPYVGQMVLTSSAVDPRWAVTGNIWYGEPFDFLLADVFNPDLPAYAEKQAQKIAKPNDPLLLAYYPDEPDNLKGFWPYHPHLGLAILCSPMEIGCTAEIPKKSTTQPKTWPNYTKRVFIDHLKQKYGNIAKLNDAWGTSFADFKDLETVKYDKNQFGDWHDPQRKDHPAFRQDLDEIFAMFTEKYCHLVKDAIHKFDPNHAIAFMFYGKDAAMPTIDGFKKAGGFDYYLCLGDASFYKLLERPFQRTVYLVANSDSPLRFQGTIDKWELTADAEGQKPDPKGSWLKLYDDKADYWFRLKFAGWRLPIQLNGLPLTRAKSDAAGKGQVLYTGQDADGKSWFTVRPGDAYANGTVQEWAAALDQLKSEGKQATYLRSCAQAKQGWDFSTQAERGKAWANYVDEMVNTKTPDGDYFLVGLEQWKWMDNGWTYWVEQNNFGLVTLKDNAYDGKEATKLGADGKAGTWDDEDADYGDCISAIRTANQTVYPRILQQMK